MRRSPTRFHGEYDHGGVLWVGFGGGDFGPFVKVGAVG